MVRLDKICDIERAVKGKVYPKGCTAIQVSATKGDVIYLEEDREIEVSKYAVVIPKIDVDGLYLFTVIEQQMPMFLERYKTGLNLQIETLKYIHIPKKHIKTQRLISSFIRLFDLYYQQEEKIIELEQELKKNVLANMFV